LNKSAYIDVEAYGVEEVIRASYLKKQRSAGNPEAGKHTKKKEKTYHPEGGRGGKNPGRGVY